MRNLKWLSLIFIFTKFTNASNHEKNGNGYIDSNCETVYTTVTPPAFSTFTYTTTVVVPAGSAGIVTKYVDKPQSIIFITSTIEGQTKTLTVYTTSIKFVGATTTKVSTSTYTTFPNAVTTVYSTETLLLFVKGTLTTTFPDPAVTIPSASRYTGAPTSLWLSVI